MVEERKKIIAIAHYGLDRKIIRAECEASLATAEAEFIYVDLDAGVAKLDELYDLPFENIALAQERQFVTKLTPLLAAHPNAEIAYFGLCPIPVAFQLGYLLGNTRRLTIYHWHHARAAWYAETTAPNPDYKFQVIQPTLPLEIQKGKGDVVIRLSTSFQIDPKATLEVCRNPANEFDITL